MSDLNSYIMFKDKDVFGNKPNGHGIGMNAPPNDELLAKLHEVYN